MIEVIGAARIYEQLLSHISAMGKKTTFIMRKPSKYSFSYDCSSYRERAHHVRTVHFKHPGRFPIKSGNKLVTIESPYFLFQEHIHHFALNFGPPPPPSPKSSGEKMERGDYILYSASPLNAAQRPFGPRPGLKPFSTCTSGLRPNDE